MLDPLGGGGADFVLDASGFGVGVGKIGVVVVCVVDAVFVVAGFSVDANVAACAIFVAACVTDDVSAVAVDDASAIACCGVLA